MKKLYENKIMSFISDSKSLKIEIPKNQVLKRNHTVSKDNDNTYRLVNTIENRDQSRKFGRP